MAAVTPSDLIPGLIDIGQRAGRAIMAVRSEDLDVRHKSDGSPVTRADLQSQQVILDGLERLAPGVPVISEERAVPPLVQRRTWPMAWLVDPLDGTREFVAGRDDFVVSIALIVGDLPVLGIIHEPVARRFILACRLSSQGPRWICFCQAEGGPRLDLPPATPGRGEEGGLRVIVSHRRGDRDLQSLPDSLKDGEPPRVIKAGSALKFNRLASGEADFYVRSTPTCEWDTAAGQAILQAVGGGLCDFHGATLRYNRRETLINPGFYAFGARLAHRRWLTGSRD